MGFTTTLGVARAELAALEWQDLDFDRRLITMRRSFDGPTTSDRVRYVPILDPLLPLPRAWRLRHPGRLVFTNQAGTMIQPSARIFQEVLHRVLATGGFPRVQRRGKRAAVLGAAPDDVGLSQHRPDRPGTAALPEMPVGVHVHDDDGAVAPGSSRGLGKGAP